MSDLKNPVGDQTISSTTPPPSFPKNYPGFNFLRNLNIGDKLNLGFSVLVMLTLLVAGLNFVGNREATASINLAEQAGLPTTLALAQAQTNLLRMQANVRGYLVLGNLNSIGDYHQARRDFEANLAELDRLSPNWQDDANRQRLVALKVAFQEWVAIPEQLFELHDNPLENQPALRLTQLEASPLSQDISQAINRLIEIQEERLQQNDDSSQISQLAMVLNNMIKFQTSFEAMTTHLQAYALTGDLRFKQNYNRHLALNVWVWENLATRQRQAPLLTTQQATWQQLAESREQFLTLPTQIFEAVESDQAYNDLYLYSTEAVPQTEQMLQLLDDMVTAQQSHIQADLSQARFSLTNAQSQTLVGGLLAVILGAILALIFRENIAGPVRRLTNVAEQITAGDLMVQIDVESQDEIGRLATILKLMTQRLRQTIDHLTRQSQQMETVIDISQQLTSTLDLEQLLQYTVNHIRDDFDFYHVHIYLVEPETKALVMTEGSGEVGQQLKAKGHRLSYGQGIVGTVASSNQPFMSNNVDEVAEFYRNPLLPKTNSELAVPLRKGNQVLGVLDIQSEQRNRFTPAEVKLMQSIANQTAITLDNARLLAERQATIVKLREVDLAKSQFITMMSHELRTPLNAINGFAELLALGLSGELPPRAQEEVEIIHASGQHLLALIDNILDIAKIESGQTDIQPEILNAQEVINEVTLSSTLLINDKPIELVINLPETLPAIYADYTRLKQIFLNLVGNAIKFTTEGRVTIEAALSSELSYPQLNPHSDRVCFSIIDTGIGIPVDKQQLIFDHFQQVDMSDARQYGGAGLGLTICKQLVELHGGDIGLVSQVGQGTTFWFTIPVANNGSLQS